MNSQTDINEDDALRRVRTVLARVTAEGNTVARLDNSEHQIFPVAVSAVEGQALRNWVIKEAVAHTIEIGLAYGISALFICEGLVINGQSKVQHVVVDPYQHSGFKDCGLQLLEEAGVADLVEFHAQESQILLPKFLSEGRQFDFAFVDGSHFFERVFLDLIYLGRLVEPGSIIFVDDYQLPAITHAVSFCLKNLGWTLEEISQPDELHQWSVLRTPRDPVARTFRDFVDF